ncbi:MAG: hypothetical protein JSV80_11605, partial [Acidobacteriota bacterium]
MRTLITIRARNLRRARLFVLLLAGTLCCTWSAAEENERKKSPHGKIEDDCSLCHSNEGWIPARVSEDFNHERFFALDGAHVQTNCRACHTSLVFSSAEQDCSSCHQDVHQAEMGTDCSRCHSTQSFIDHSEMLRNHVITRFPLTGSHAALDCDACHNREGSGAMEFVNVPTECVACHLDDYLRAREPDHEGLGFPKDCSECHSSTEWSSSHLIGSDFDHDRTGFPLTGAHRVVDCAACHVGGVFAGTDSDCISCHRTDFEATTEPDHLASGFDTNCSLCHTTTSWRGENFDHSTTAFPLTGSHQAVDCTACHGDGVFEGKSTECVSCHRTDYDGTADPPHAAAGFGTDCTSCHTTATWFGEGFDHNTTDFPLTGAHSGVTCEACHADAVFDGKPTDCYSCHQTDYENTTDPNHIAAGYGTNCEACHDTTTWFGATFDHNATDFPLTGAHAAAECNACHSDGVYDGKPTDCYSCHQTNYEATTNPH